MPRPRAEPEPSLAETVALGVLQGPAELLPVSSSAHLELLPWLLGWRHARLAGERRKEVAVALHVGTLVPLIAAQGARAVRRPWLGAIATAPPALAGLALEATIERRLGTPLAIAGGLLAGSAALVAADAAPARRASPEAAAADALWLGLAQAAALVPGVSRSGATWSAARARGFTRAAAAELSAEAALPVLAAAGVLKALRLRGRRPPGSTWRALAAGAGAACASTAAALALRPAARAPAWTWAAYRTALAGAVLARSDRALRENGPR